MKSLLDPSNKLVFFIRITGTLNNYFQTAKGMAKAYDFNDEKRLEEDPIVDDKIICDVNEERIHMQIFVLNEKVVHLIQVINNFFRE